MARKGKLLKKPSTGGPPKRENINAEVVASKSDESKGKLPLKEGTGQGESAKKQISGDLGGLIFMCNGSTKPECFKYRVFGLNEGKKHLVEQVRKGMRLFLFDIDLRLLYGIYVASSQGTYKLERDAFGGGFPWQVRFSIQKDCLPLSEDVFQAAIKENYMDKKRFKVELTTEQVHRLVKLFRPLPYPRSPPRPRMAVHDQVNIADKARAPRYPEIDQFVHERYASRRLSPKANYETSVHERYASRRLSPKANYETSLITSDSGRFLPPLTKPESTYIQSDRYRPEKQIPGYSHSLTKYSQGYPLEERRIPDGLASDDLYLGRELRPQQDDVGSLVSAHSLAPSTLSAYGADPLRSLSDLRQPRARDELLSVYPRGNALGTDITSLYGQKLRGPDARAADVLDRRMMRLDPLFESSSVYSSGLPSDLLRGRANDNSSVYSSGLPSDLLRGRANDNSTVYSSGLHSDLLRGRANDIYAGYGGGRIENGLDPLSASGSAYRGDPLSGITGASGLAYRGDILAPSRYYGSSGY